MFVIRDRGELEKGRERVRTKAVDVVRDGKNAVQKFKGSRTDKKGGVARFDNSQNVKMRTVSPQTMF